MFFLFVVSVCELKKMDISNEYHAPGNKVDNEHPGKNLRVRRNIHTLQTTRSISFKHKSHKKHKQYTNSEHRAEYMYPNSQVKATFTKKLLCPFRRYCLSEVLGLHAAFDYKFVYTIFMIVAYLKMLFLFHF